MRFLFVDDSLCVTAATPDQRPMDGAEKALASLPGALARRGHDVMVFNRCCEAGDIDGVRWRPFDHQRPEETDVLIAFRRPSLLRAPARAKRRLLWATAPPSYLAQEGVDALLKSVGAEALFISPSQRDAYRGTRPCLIAPMAVRPPFLRPIAEKAGVRKPIAVVTTHPDHGLPWLVEQWKTRIRPQAPTASLRVYSMLLSRPQRGEAAPEELHGVLQTCRDARAQGVEIRQPLPDPGMAEAYREARAHLYPRVFGNVGCWTLAETQACGAPAVICDCAAAGERVVNGLTGYVVPDDDAFANVTATILKDDGVFRALSQAAAERAAQSSWDRSARALEAELG